MTFKDKGLMTNSTFYTSIFLSYFSYSLIAKKVITFNGWIAVYSLNKKTFSIHLGTPRKKIEVSDTSMTHHLTFKLSSYVLKRLSTHTGLITPFS